MKVNKLYFYRLLINAGLFLLPLGIGYLCEQINYTPLLKHVPKIAWLAMIMAVPVLVQSVGFLISLYDDRFRPFVYGSVIPILYTTGHILYLLVMNCYYNVIRFAPYAKDSIKVKWAKFQKMTAVLMKFDFVTFLAACACLIICRLIVVYMWKKVGKQSLMTGEEKQKDMAEGPWKGGYMKRSKVRYLTSNKTGLPLGIVPRLLGLPGGKIARFKENVDKGWLGGHHVVLSASRGGKGVSAVLPAILDHQGPVAVLDIKGELFTMTKRYREQLGRQVVVMNPFRAVDELSHVHWNPLDYVRTDTVFFDQDCDVIADSLIKPYFGKDSHFSDGSRKIIKMALGVLYETHKGKDFNLIELYKLLFANDLKKTINTWKQRKDIIGGRAAELSHSIGVTGMDQFGAYATTLDNNLSWIRTPECEEFLSRSDFDLENLLHNKLDIYCVMPINKLKTTAGFMRLFSNLVSSTVVRKSGKQNVQAPILLMLDEFTRLGHMQSILDMVTLGAGAGMDLFFVAQDLASIEAEWGESTHTLLGNIATARAFNIGGLDGKTAEFLSALTGDVTVVTQSKSSSSNDKSDQASESFSQTKDRLLSATNILQLDSKKMICFVRGHKPLILKRIISHKHPFYKHKLDKNKTLVKR